MNAAPTPGSPNPNPPQPSGGHRMFMPRAAPPAANPRKVRGGEKLEHREGAPLGWAGQRITRLIETVATPAAAAEGLAYARSGQVRSWSLASGHVSARVQGRVFSAYQVDLRLPVLTHDQWERALEAMAREARHLASLLAGEVPPGIEDVFVPLKLRLFPQDASDLAASCNCGRFAHNAPAAPWCKHVACALAMLADRLSRDPFLVFALRGLGKDDLLERLRQQRALLAARAAAGAGTTADGASGRLIPAYAPLIPGVGGQPAPPLAHCLGMFWEAPEGAPEVELALEPPVVSHPMLRRLGSSPFPNGRFPLVGLLATCYEVIGRHALEDPAPDVPPDAGSGEPPPG